MNQPVPDRPVMPAEYGVDRSAREEMLPWRYVSERMAGARNYWIATTRPDGRPHVIPVWGLWFDEAFTFSTDARSRKGRNVASNPHAVVHLESGDEVVILEGVVERVTDREQLTRFVALYDDKYGVTVDVDHPAFAVFRLRPSVAFAWQERDFPNTASRWVFEQTA